MAKKRKKGKINKVVKLLVFSDLFLYSGWGLITPILAIYIIGNIQAGDAKVAGIAIGMYWIGKSIFQIPIAHYLDKNHGEKDDYYSLIVGTFLMALTPIGFIFATMPWHMYVLQLVHGFAMAAALPAWSAIFTRHIEKKREAFCWSLDSSTIGLGAGISGIVGGTIANTFGFIPLFIGVSVLGLIAGIVLLFIGAAILPKIPRKGALAMPKP